MLLDYMLNRMMNILGNLTVFEDKMMKDIYLTNGVIFAQRVMNALIGKGFAREKAYDTVQPVAMAAMANNLSYKELLKENEVIRQTLTADELESCFTLDYYLKNVDYIYERNGIK